MVIAEFWNDITGVVTVSLIFGGWVIVAVVGSIAKNWRRIQESEHAAALKQGMIERGMSADEIERVLRAGPGPAENEAIDDTSELATKLAEHGVSGQEMEEILTAYCNARPAAKKTLSQTVIAMVDGGATSEQILAAARALSRLPSDQPLERQFTDRATSFRP